MKILLVVNKVDRGGASRVAQSLRNAFIALGHDPMLVAGYSDVGYPSNFSLINGSRGALLFRALREIESRAWRRLGLRPGAQFTSGLSPFSEAWLLRKYRPDAVHFHNAAPFLFRTYSGRATWSRARFVTLHDSWPFTGGCHVPANCAKFKVGCRDCPLFESRIGRYNVVRLAKRKVQVSRILRVRYIAPSNSVAVSAAEAGLADARAIKVIPNPIDNHSFWPIDKKAAKLALGLDTNCKLLLAGANFLDIAGKGIGALRDLYPLLKRRERLKIALFGRTSSNMSALIPNGTIWLGHSDNDSLLRLWYSAADVFLTLSSSETFGLTVAEALACGTPVVGWAVGGLVDVVREGVDGHLVPLGNLTDLARVTDLVIESEHYARTAPEYIGRSFGASVIATEHINFYREQWAAT